MQKSRSRNRKPKVYGIKRNRRLFKRRSDQASWNIIPSYGKDLLKIGVKNDLYKDSSSSTSYPWTRLTPVFDHNLPHYTHSKRGIPSLKLICSKIIAENAGSLESSYLDTASWTVWQQVWEEILLLHNDSLRVFGLFADKFSSMNGFKCHWSPLSSEVNLQSPKWEMLMKVRSDAISSVIIPMSRNHRVENLFANINILDIVRYIHKLSYCPWVLLDVSLMRKKYDREDHLKIFSITNLVALDLSNSQLVDDLFLYNMSVSISKDGKLSKLTILKINNCPNVTSKGLQYLHLLSNDPDSNCSLSYIESDVQVFASDFATKFQNIKRENTNFIEGTRWSLLDDDPVSKSIRKLPLALKLHCLYKNYSSRIIKSPIFSIFPLNTTNSMSYLFQVRNKIVLDLMVHEKDFTSLESDFEKLSETWETRIHLRNLRTRFKTHCYIIDNNYECPVQSSESNESTNLKKDDSVMYRATEKKSILKNNIARKRRKPMVRKFDANQFFDM